MLADAGVSCGANSVQNYEIASSGSRAYGAVGRQDCSVCLRVGDWGGLGGVHLLTV